MYNIVNRLVTNIKNKRVKHQIDIDQLLIMLCLAPIDKIDEWKGGSDSIQRIGSIFKRQSIKSINQCPCICFSNLSSTQSMEQYKALISYIKKHNIKTNRLLITLSAVDLQQNNIDSTLISTLTNHYLRHTPTQTKIIVNLTKTDSIIGLNQYLFHLHRNGSMLPFLSFHTGLRNNISCNNRVIAEIQLLEYKIDSAIPILFNDIDDFNDRILLYLLPKQLSQLKFNLISFLDELRAKRKKPLPHTLEGLTFDLMSLPMDNAKSSNVRRTSALAVCAMLLLCITLFVIPKAISQQHIEYGTINSLLQGINKNNVVARALTLNRLDLNKWYLRLNITDLHMTHFIKQFSQRMLSAFYRALIDLQIKNYSNLSTVNTINQLLKNETLNPPHFIPIESILGAHYNRYYILPNKLRFVPIIYAHTSYSLLTHTSNTLLDQGYKSQLKHYWHYFFTHVQLHPRLSLQQYQSLLNALLAKSNAIVLLTHAIQNRKDYLLALQSYSALKQVSPDDKRYIPLANQLAHHIKDKLKSTILLFLNQQWHLPTMAYTAFYSEYLLPAEQIGITTNATLYHPIESEMTQFKSLKTINVTPLSLSPSVRSVMLSFNNDTLIYSHGPTLTTTLNNLQAAIPQASIQFDLFNGAIYHRSYSGLLAIAQFISHCTHRDAHDSVILTYCLQHKCFTFNLPLNEYHLLAINHNLPKLPRQIQFIGESNGITHQNKV